jgi:hypothetical protein
MNRTVRSLSACKQIYRPVISPVFVDVMHDNIRMQIHYPIMLHHKMMGWINFSHPCFNYYAMLKDVFTMGLEWMLIAHRDV